MNTLVSEKDIRVEMTLKANRDKVWSALTTRDGWRAWFSEDVAGTFAPGETLTLDFEGYGQVQIEIVEMVDRASLAYKWHPGGCDASDPAEERTTVRFELSDSEGGTKLVMTESGFDRIPLPKRQGALGMNSDGWGSELGALRAWVDAGEIQPSSGGTIIRERFYPQARPMVWDAVATPGGLCGWFCKRTAGEFAVGQMVVLTFDFGSEFDGPCRIESCQKGESFSYRWHPGQDDGCKWEDFPESEATLVEVVLSDFQGGTLLKVKETGFANIPDTRREKVYGMNSAGWEEVGQMVADYLEKQA